MSSNFRSFLNKGFFWGSLVLLASLATTSGVKADGYPWKCSGCQTQGSWCVHPSTGYMCGNSSYCGARYADSNFCPPGCTCGAYYAVPGNWCSNNCIAVEWCSSGPTPPPTSPPTPPPSSCSITSVIPNPVTVTVGGTQTVTAFTTGTLSYVYFVPNSSLVTTNPVFNYSAPYTTTVTGVSVGSTTINVGGHDNASGVDCTNTMLVPVTVTGATPTPAPALPVGASVSKSCSNPGETVTFTMTYHDPRGWSDIAYAYLLLNSVNNARTDDSPKGALETILNVTTGQYQIRNQTDSAWLPFGTTTNGYATVAGLSYSGSGNTLTVTWSITFLSAWEKENANVYAQVTDRTTWIPSGFWDLNDFLVNGCATPTPTPTPVGAWWQVKDGDVWAKGSLASRVASGKVFLEVGNGGFPGVPSYTGSLNTGSGTVSTKGWNAVSDYLGTTYNYAYFENLATGATFNQINSTLIDDEHYFESGGTASADGYYWYQFDGSAGAMAGQDLTISSNKINLKKDRKTILLVKSADLYLNGDTDINNEGFFLVVVGKNGAGGKGSIVVGTGAKDLDGLFVADGAFKTNTNGTNDSQLTVTGAVAAGSFDLNRTLGTENKNKPAELFIYNPALLFYYPPGLTTRQVSWREIPP